MRARSREINIFSLSLMDVISGAMGAFLIIMIILARYYVFDPNVTQNVDELKLRLDAAVQGLNRIRGGTEEIFNELIVSETGARTSGLGAGDTLDQIEAVSRAIREDVDRVNNQLAAVHEEANRLEAELQEKSAQLQRADERMGDLEIRNPFVVASKWNCDADIDLAVESDRTSAATDEPAARFDPRVRRGDEFEGDVSSDGHEGASHEMNMIGRTPRNTNYKIFVSIRTPAPGVACEVRTHAMGMDFFANMPLATLTEAGYFDYLGVVTVGEDLKFEFAAPDETARRAELEAVRQRVATTPAPAE